MAPWPHSTFGQLRRAHPAVLPIYRYHHIPQLLAVLDEAVVRPLELFVRPGPLVERPSSSIAVRRADGAPHGCGRDSPREHMTPQLVTNVFVT
ncbi:MAG TPA: hypothetical protein VF510_20645 [Ktedonobacterales bacterium]